MSAPASAIDRLCAAFRCEFAPLGAANTLKVIEALDEVLSEYSQEATFDMEYDRRQDAAEAPHAAWV